MNKKKIIKKIQDNGDELRKYGVRKIGLFGSCAKGNFRWNSDVDLLITLDKKTFKNYMGALFLLKSLLRRKVDLVLEEDLKPALRHVKKEAEYVRI